MTFNPAVPLTSQSPSLFPAQNQTNMTRLKTIVAADHQFNDTAASNDGFHNVVHLTQQAPSGTDSVGRLYVKQSGTGSKMHLFYMDDTAVTSLNYQITPTLPIRAAVNFDGLGAIRGTAYNVSSVTLPSTGHFKVNFTTNMPDANYIVQVTGMGTSTTVQASCVGSIAGDTIYGNSMNVAFVIVSFIDLSVSPAAFISPLTGCVTIFSVT